MEEAGSARHTCIQVPRLPGGSSSHSNGKAQDTFQTSFCVMNANIPLVKGSHLATPVIKGQVADSTNLEGKSSHMAKCKIDRRPDQNGHAVTGGLPVATVCV